MSDFGNLDNEERRKEFFQAPFVKGGDCDIPRTIFLRIFFGGFRLAKFATVLFALRSRGPFVGVLAVGRAGAGIAKGTRLDGFPAVVGHHTTAVAIAGNVFILHCEADIFCSRRYVF